METQVSPPPSAELSWEILIRLERLASAEAQLLCRTIRSLCAERDEHAHALRTRPDYDFRCQQCGAPHNLDTSIPSAIWNAIAPDVGALCTLCIDERMAAAGLTGECEFYFHGKALTSKLYDAGQGELEDAQRQLSAYVTAAEGRPASELIAPSGVARIIEERDNAKRGESDIGLALNLQTEQFQEHMERWHQQKAKLAERDAEIARLRSRLNQWIERYGTVEFGM